MHAAPTISIVIPVRNSPGLLRACIEGIQKSTYKDFEIIVVDDASTDDTPEIAERMGVRPIRLPSNVGPAIARNHAAEFARGTYLFFIDADVRVHADTIEKIAASFQENPEVDAVFGSYDREPHKYNILSQYRNLFHHFIHQQGHTQASTFWTGCGAIKRDVFMSMGGFDASYGRPCIEDIELGTRLRKHGHRIMLRKDIQVTHFKKWTLWNMLKTDVRDRGIPWTELILRERNLPNDLNLTLSQRLSALLAYSSLAMMLLEGLQLRGVLLLPFGVLATIIFLDYWSEKRRVPTTVRILSVAGLIAATVAIGYYGKVWLILSFSCLIGIILLNLQFYAFFARERGALFSALVLPLHVFYYLYSGFSFTIGTIFFLWKNKVRIAGNHHRGA